jgi:hypothetical protein
MHSTAKVKRLDLCWLKCQKYGILPGTKDIDKSQVAEYRGVQSVLPSTSPIRKCKLREELSLFNTGNTKRLVAKHQYLSRAWLN